MAYRMQRAAPVSPKVVAILGIVGLLAGSVLVFVAPRPAQKSSDKVAPKPTSGYTISATEAPEPTRKAEPSEKPTKPKATTSPSPSSSPSAVRPSRSDDPSPRSDSPTPVKPKPKPTTAKPKPTPTPTPKPAPTTVKPTPKPTPTVDLRANAVLRAQVISLINQQRANAGLGQLASNSDLSDKSQVWSASMASRGVLVHSSPPSNKLWGEIIASGYTTAESVVNGWMNSPGHRARILDPQYTLIGSGYVNGYWTVQFG
jgi:uncharacterized protein YkwD